MACCCAAIYYAMQYVMRQPVAVGVTNQVVIPAIEEEKIDDSIAQEDQHEEPIVQEEHDEAVVIQSYHSMPEQEPVIQEEDEQIVELATITQPCQIVPHDSFVTTEFRDGAQLDATVQQSFDLLLSKNIDGLLDLIVQSNNNVLAQNSCKSCAIGTILKKVVKRKALTVAEIISLQHVVENLYKFVNTMQALGQKTILTHEQFLALKNLNTSQVSIKQIARESRQAATIAALQSLKNIDMVQRQG